MYFAPLKYEMLFQGRVGSKPNIVLVEEVLSEVDKFCYLKSYIWADNRVSDEMSSCKPKTQLAFSDPWHPPDVRLTVRCPVYITAVWSIFLYGREVRPLQRDLRMPSVFGPRRIRNISWIWQMSFVINWDVRHLVLCPGAHYLEEALNINRSFY